MTKPHPTQAMIALYDRFTHVGDLSRRDMVAQMARLAGGTAAANALLGLIAARADAAPLVAADDARIKAGDVRFSVGAGREMAGYLAQPAKGAATASRVLVIHENRGLNDHIRDVARRLAAEGLVALAADFLAPNGGTPTLGDATTNAEDKARTMIGTLDRQQTVADGVATLKWLAASTPGKGVPGAVGFCWGGGVVNTLATATPALDAGVVFYGVAPKVEDVSKIKASLIMHHASLDARVNATLPPYEAALKAANIAYQLYMYEGVNHAFHNETSAERYNDVAAKLAWQRTVDFFKAKLA